MAKDPALLFYIANWLTSTAGMDADARGWYLNLMLHNYDKGGLENDIEILAQLAGVKFSEFERFKQVLEQVLKQKFVINEASGLLENPKTMEILKSREVYKDKRQRSGNIGVVIKTAKSIIGFNKKYIEMLKDQLFTFTDEEIEQAKAEQVLKQMLKLYINININKDISIEDNKLSIVEAKNSKNFIAPSIQDFIEYFFTNGFSKELAERAWKGYDASDWKDSTGKQIKNWKQKCQHVWFKETNKETANQSKFEKLKQAYTESQNPYL